MNNIITVLLILIMIFQLMAYREQKNCKIREDFYKGVLYKTIDKILEKDKAEELKRDIDEKISKFI